MFFAGHILKTFQFFFRFGRRPMFFAGLLMLLIVGCVAAASPSMFVFIPFYILQGAAQTGLFLVAYTMCMYVYHDVGSVFKASVFLWTNLDVLSVVNNFGAKKLCHPVLWCKEIMSSCILPSFISCLQLSNKENWKGNCNTDCMWIDNFCDGAKSALLVFFCQTILDLLTYDEPWILCWCMYNTHVNNYDYFVDDPPPPKKEIIFNFRLLWRKYYTLTTVYEWPHDLNTRIFLYKLFIDSLEEFCCLIRLSLW